MMKRLFTAALIFGAVAQAPPVSAMTHCAKRDVIVDRLAEFYDESQASIGLSNSRKMIEIWTSAGAGTWTLLMTRPDGISCVIDSGTHWQEMERDGTGAKVAG